MKRFILIIVLVFICLSPPPSTAIAANPVVRIQDDHLTLDVTNQPLATVLGMLSDQGIRIRIDPRINPKISAKFSRRPIGPAISSILKSYDYALIWRKDKMSADPEPRLWEIRIFYKGQEARIRPLDKSGNLTIVRAGDGTYHVKDILLLRLASGITEEALAALLDRLGASLIDAYAPLGIVRLRLPHGSDVPAIADAIADAEGIQTAEPDYAYPLEGGRPEASGTWSTASPPSQPPSGGQTMVAVMDSGLLSDYQDNPYVAAAYDAVSPGAEVGDELGHGTQMALIAAGAVNPMGSGSDVPAGSPVVAIRAFDDSGFTSTYTLMRGIDYAIEKGARVLSLSWGSETTSSLLESATRYASAKGLILVAAAGNAPTGKPVYPAAYDNVIGVGALNPDGDAWDQSNFGDSVTVTAPGMADLPVGYNGDPGIYAAILSGNPDADVKTIMGILTGGN